MKILVTGSDGLVGTAIKKIQNNFNDSFVFFNRKSCDLLNFDLFLEKVKQENADCILHLASNVGGLYKNINQKVSMFEDNITMNSNVIKTCHILNLKFVGCLSTCIFPDKVKYPIKEECLFDGAPHESNYAYAYAKRMMEIQCKTYRDQYGSDFRCFIPTNLYGPNDNFNIDNSHVIPGLIHKCYLAKQNNQDFIVSGTGKPLRQFMYAEDFANIIIKEMKKEQKSPVIVSPNQEVSIKDVAFIIADNFNYKNRIKFDSTKSDGQYKKTVISNINYKFKELKDGIKETIEWFLQNYEKIRK